MTKRKRAPIENDPRKDIRSWEKYEYKGALSIANAEDLRPVVRRAAKAANGRLLRLERKGYIGGAYAIAQKRLAQSGRTRFKERTSKMNIAELRTEYARLRDFLAAKSSTIGGKHAIDDKRFQTAVARGFTGTAEEFADLSNRLWTENVEALYSSDVIYDELLSNDEDEINYIIEKAKSAEFMDSKIKGQNVLEHLRRKRERKAKKRKENKIKKGLEATRVEK